MRSERFAEVCSKATISLNIEIVVPSCRYVGEVGGQYRSGGGTMPFRISPHRLGRIPGGVEVRWRNWGDVGAKETVSCQCPRCEPRVLAISTKRRVSACGPRRGECAIASAMACESQEDKGCGLIA